MTLLSSIGKSVSSAAKMYTKATVDHAKDNPGAWTFATAILSLILTQAFTCYNARQDRERSERHWTAHQAVDTYYHGSNAVARIESAATNNVKAVRQ